ncbi:hypothetical protein [Streptomyces sp. 3MP-14]|uniref:hypothetical protein n=1 Tax=Streptomyces sp. 3MP-14 TaxID=2586636 RepID=UPI00186B4DA2|nr:hypothetical protein [Streptomyces sp. 3MP-14]
MAVTSPSNGRRSAGGSARDPAGDPAGDASGATTGEAFGNVIDAPSGGLTGGDTPSPRSTIATASLLGNA